MKRKDKTSDLLHLECKNSPTQYSSVGESKVVCATNWANLREGRGGWLPVSYYQAVMGFMNEEMRRAENG